jgi:hypothetical protein
MIIPEADLSNQVHGAPIGASQWFSNQMGIQTAFCDCLASKFRRGYAITEEIPAVSITIKRNISDISVETSE